MLARTPAFVTTEHHAAPRAFIESLLPALDTAFGVDRSGLFPEEIARLVARLGGGRPEEPETLEAVELLLADG
ncbi:hypothetical protein [Methylobacterium sp. ID0610]|uniref:hypothetical protein n=1 Tax=Methylobacterium carpenticola TaxID=3344827 RepID=UPI0036C87DFD